MKDTQRLSKHEMQRYVVTLCLSDCLWSQHRDDSSQMKMRLIKVVARASRKMYQDEVLLRRKGIGLIRRVVSGETRGTVNVRP